MATTGWLGEQTVHQWGGWGTRFTTNVYISGIRRYSDHVDVSGTIYLYCKSNGAYSVWYDWNITSWSMGNNLGQIKERTYTNNILNRSWGKNFTVRINCSNSATSATFNAGFSDSNMGGRDKYWTIYFDRYATAPSGIKSTSSYTEYSTITTSCSGINWGQGYSNRKLTCTASYTFNGKTENFTLGTWNDGATSKTVTKNDFNFPADLNVSVKWIASTNVGSTTSSSQVRVGQTYPAPNLSEVNFEGSSQSTYKLNATVTGINYGENYSKREANLYFDYTLDGISYSTLLFSISDGSSSMTVEYDATTESEPWKFIPDDEKGTLRLVVDNGHRISTKSSAQIYCQPQYEAYIVESIPDSEKEKSEIYTGKNIQIQNAPKDAPLADFKLYGDTFQQSYKGKNLININFTNSTSNGVTKTLNSDGSITLNGHTTQGHKFEIAPAVDYEIGQTYTIHIEVLSGSFVPYNSNKDCAVIFVYSKEGSSGLQTNITENGATASYTPTSSMVSQSVRLWFAFNSNTTSELAIFNNFTFRVQIEKDSTATSYEPYVGGVPSPNPDYPQPIQTVTGTQTVEIRGKNLFRAKDGQYRDSTLTVDVENGRIHVYGHPHASFDQNVWIPVEDIHADGTYTLTMNYSGFGGGSFRLTKDKSYKGDNNFGGTYYSPNMGTPVTASATDITYNWILIYLSHSNAQAEVDYYINPQFESGSLSTAFVPYSNQTYEINLGKNMFDKNVQITNGYTYDRDGSMVTLGNCSVQEAYIQVKPNATYTLHTDATSSQATDFRVYICEYDSGKGFIKRDVPNPVASSTNTIITTANTHFVRLCFSTVCIDTLQFEAGSTATTYAPYFEPIELCKLGDYQDYIWKDGEDWKIHKDIGKYQFNGSEPWIRSGLTTNDTFVAAISTKLQDYLKVKDSNTLKSAYFIQHNSVKASGRMKAYNGNETAPIAFALSFDATSITDITDATTWISNNKPIVYSAINNPTDTTITDQTLIEQLEAISNASLQSGTNNITNIAIAPNLAGDMEIRYYTKWQDTFPATLYSNGKNGTGQFKQIRRIGTK